MALSSRSLRAMKPLSSYFPVAAAAMQRPWTFLSMHAGIRHIELASLPVG